MSISATNPLTTYMKSPIGDLKLEATEQGLSSLTLVDEVPVHAVSQHSNLLDEVISQLDAYFLGDLKIFDIPFDVSHSSDFYQQVWTELTLIPYGTTINYGELAARVGTPKGAQAVGLANGKNPIAIIVPCHRVVGSNGSMTGYAWGVDKKRWLLLHERSHVPIPAGQLF